MSVADWELVVGIEVHAQLSTASKLFCGCATRFAAPPNTQTCPVCLGMPGSLPVMNEVAFDYCLLTALALNCQIAPRTSFDRKNYYYPDLPKNYQISQNYHNLGVDGWLDLSERGNRRRVRIHNVHLEEDAGKLTHPEGGPRDYSCVDLNRAGTPLAEIVTYPDMRGVAEAEDYMEQLKETLLYLGVCDCKMEEGSLRFEASCSVRRHGTEALGNRVEVKNLNSMKAVVKVLEHEYARQVETIEQGGQIERETRLWDDEKGESRRMRGKEAAHDYRYFPEPDLAPVAIDPAWLDRLRARIPELPVARRERFVRDYGLPAYDASVLCADKPLADWYEACAKAAMDPKAASNWVMNDLTAAMKDRALPLADVKVSPRALAELIALVRDGAVSGPTARQQVFPRMLDTGKPPREIVEAEGLSRVSDEATLKALAARFVAESPDAVASFRKGKQQALQAILGKVMRETKGKADPKLVLKLISDAVAAAP